MRVCASREDESRFEKIVSKLGVAGIVLVVYALIMIIGYASCCEFCICESYGYWAIVVLDPAVKISIWFLLKKMQENE